MVRPIANGAITIVDLNDAILSGTAPLNPVNGTLWIDTSSEPNKLFCWDGANWVEQSLSVGALDPDFYDQVQNLRQFAKDAADDGLISAGEKLNIKLLLVETTGETSFGTVLPTIAQMDTSKSGQVYMVRAEARAAGVATSHADYTAFESSYNTLKAYLDTLSPRPWEQGNTLIDKTKWDNAWDSYYEKLTKLQVTTSTYLANSLKPGANYNGVKMSEESGLVVLRGDNVFRTTLNATQGIAIEKNINGTWTKMFYTNTDGKIYAKGLVLSADSTIDGTALSSIVSDVSTTKSNVSGLQTNMTNAQTAIEQSKQQIALRATTETVDKIQGTVSEHTSALDIQSKAIEQRVTKKELENLSLGGRNLLKKSIDYSYNSGWRFDRANVLSTMYRDTRIVEAPSDWSGVDYSAADLLNRKVVTNGKQYTLSVYARLTGSAERDLKFYFDGSEKTNTSVGKVTSEWQRFSVTFNWIDAVKTSYMRFEASGLDNQTFNLQTAGFKLEEGILLSDWTPAPEDLDERFLNADQRITNAETRITQSENSIKLKAEKSVVDQDISGIKTRLQDAETSIELNTDEINLRAKSSDVSEIDGRVKKTETDLKLAQDAITQTVKKSDYEVAVGLNKWIASKYDMNLGSSAVIPNFDHIKGKKPVATIEYADSARLQPFNSDYYMGYYYTNVYVAAVKSVSITVSSDDGASIFLNGESVYGKGSTTTTTTLFLDFKAGWNTIEILHYEHAGGEFVNLGAVISTKVDKMSSVIGGGNKNETRLVQAETTIKQTNDAVLTKAEKNDVYTKTEADGKITTAVNNAKSEIAVTTEGIKQTVTDTNSKIDNLKIGGRNLLRNTKDFQNFTYTGLSKGSGVTGTLAIIDDPVQGKVIKATYDGGTSWWVFQNSLYSYFPQRFNPGQEYTTTMLIKSTAQFSLTYMDGNGSNSVFDYSYFPSTNGEWKVVTTTKKAKISGNNPMFYLARGNEIGEIQIAWMKLEEGNRATDYTPAPEEVEGKIGTLDSKASSIDQKADSIRADVTTLNTTVNKQGQTISSQGTSIEQLNNSITSKAEKSDVYTKSETDGKVSTAISTAKTEIKQTTDAITSTVTAANTKIDNINVGGVNILPSSDSKGGWLIQGQGVITDNFIDDPMRNQVGMSGLRIGTAATTEVVVQSTRFRIKKNTEYTLSFWYYVGADSKGIDVFFMEQTEYQASQNYNYQNYKLLFSDNTYSNGTWKRKEITFKTTTTSDVTHGFVRLDNNGTNNGTTYVYVAGLKLEEGNKATTWSPSFSDINTQITTVSDKQSELQQNLDGFKLTVYSKSEADGKVADAKSEIKQTTDGIKQSVTNLQSTVNSQGSTISSHTSSISQLNSSITSKVEKSDVYTKTEADGKINSAVNTAKSEIKQTTDGIVSTVSAVDTKVNNLSIGGRNFIPNSKAPKMAPSNYSSGTYVISTVSLVDAAIDVTSVTQVTRGATGGGDVRLPDMRNTGDVSGNTYTLSAYCKPVSTTESSKVWFYLGTTSDKQRLSKDYVLPANQWTRVVYTYKFADNTNEIGIRPYFTLDYNQSIYVAKAQLEQGDRATSWNASPEDVSSDIASSVSSAKSEIKQTTDGISQSVSNLQSTVNSQGSTISSHTSSINQLNNSITSKVEKTDVYTKAEADGKINSAVSTAKSEIKQTTDGITSTVASLDTKVNNISVGGRNLLRYTKDFSTGWGIFQNVAKFEVVDDSRFGKALQATTDGSATSRNPALRNTIFTDVIPGQEMTVSLWIKRETAGTVSQLFKFRDVNGSESNPVAGSEVTVSANTWYYYTQTFKVPSNVVQVYLTPRIVTSEASKKFWIAQPKLESGNKVTDWTPAPEDIDAGIQTVDSKASAVDQKADSIRSDVTSLSGTVSGHTSTLSSQATSISQLNNSITSKAEKTDVYTKSESDGKISSAVSSAKSEIKQTTDGITQSVTATNSKIDNIQIGGRNLFQNSATFDGYRVGSDNGNASGFAKSVADANGAYNVVTFPNGGNIYFYPNMAAKRLAGKTYTISLEIKTTKTYKGYWYAGDGVNHYNTLSFPNTNDKWQRWSFTYDQLADEIGDKLFGFQSAVAGDVISFRKIKLEEGSKSSDWTPAPEDVDANISNSIETAKTEIKQTTDSITSSVAATNTKVDNISIGGRNLLLNTSLANGTANWNLDGTGFTIIDAESDKPNSKIFKYTRSGLTGTSIKSGYSSWFTASNGEELTFSADFKVTDFAAYDVKNPFIIEFHDASNNRVQFRDISLNDCKITTLENQKWVRIVYVAKVAISSVVKGRMRISLFKNGEVFYRELMVERSNRASEWTPAPEDIDSNISAAVSTAKSEIKQTTDSITSSVEATNTKIDNIQVGGRNLLLHTDQTFTASVTGNTFAATGGALKDAFTRDNQGLLLEKGQTYTIQYEYSISNYKSGVGFGLGSGTVIGDYNADTFQTVRLYDLYGGASGKVVYTFTYNSSETRYLAFRPMRVQSGNDSNTMTISISKLKVEKGHKATDYTVAPEDIDANIASSIATAKSEIKQTTDSITSTVTATNTKIDNLQIGGRNLLRESAPSITTGSYMMKTFPIALSIPDGTKVTVSLKGVLGSGKTSFGIYNSGGSVSLISLYPSDSDANGIFTKTFTWRVGASSNTSVNVYQMSSTVSANSTIEWIKIEKGDKATDYTPAPEDVDANISAAVSTAKSEIKQTTDSITSSVTATNTKIDKISIGGRNLIQNSDFSKGFDLWGISNSKSTILLNSFFQGKNVIQSTVSSSYVDAIQYIENISPSTEYTFSANLGGAVKIYLVEYKADGSATATYRDNYHYYPAQNFNGLTPRISFTFTTQADTGKLRLFFRVEKKAEETSTGGRATNLKLEQGNKATDWTPAPEDIDASIAKSVSDAKSEIKQTTDSITSSVTATNTKIDNLQIGGRNFVRNGDFNQDFGKAFWTNWGISNGDKTIVSASDLTGFKNAAQIKIPGINRGISQAMGTFPAGTYTMSGWFKSTAAGKDYLQASVNVNGALYYYSTPRVTTSWSFLTKTFTLDGPGSINLQVGRGGGDTTATTLLVTGLKVESGNYATDWSQNPDDVDANVTDAVSTAKSEIKQTTDSITSTVTSTNTRIDNISVGGRNIARNSGNFIDTTGWALNGTSGTLIEAVVVDGMNVIHGKGSLSGTQIDIPFLKPNTDYVYSMEIKLADAFTATTNTPAHFWLGTSSGGSHDAKATTKLVSPASIPANTWTKIILQIKTRSTLPSGLYFRPFIYGLASSSSEFWLKNVKFEEGTLPTDWTPSPEDVSSNITTAVSAAKSEIKQTTDSITSSVTATNTKIDNIKIGGRNLAKDSKYAELFPKDTGQSSDNYVYKPFYVGIVKGQEYTVSFKVEQTAGTPFNVITIYEYTGGKTFDAPIVDGMVSYTFTATSDTSDRILLYAGKSGSTRGNGAIFRDVMIENGNKKSEWTPAPEDVDARMDNIQIGGRNKILNSSFKNDFDQWSRFGATSTVVDDISSPTNKAARLVGSSGGLWFPASKLGPSGMEVGKQYTTSIIAKGTGTLEFGLERLGTTSKVTLTSTYTKYTVTQTATTTQNVIFYVGGTADVYIHSIKLEEYDRATEWTPAPEDLYGLVQTVDSKASAIDQKADSIKSTVTSLSTTVSGQGTTINSHTSSINQLNNAITSKVEKTDVYTKSEADGKINSAVSTAKSEIKQTTDGITQTVSAVDTRVSNLSIGGRNLLTNSGNFKDLTGWKQYSSAYPLTGFALINDSTYGKVITATGSDVSARLRVGSYIPYLQKANRTLTFSMIYSHTGTDNVSFGGKYSAYDSSGEYDSFGGKNYEFTDLGNGYKKMVCTVNLTYNQTTRSFFCYVYVKSQTINIVSCKLEEGDKATDWSPAPEDIDVSIASSISDAKSEIKQTTDSITQSVSSVNTKFDNLSIGGRNLVLGTGTPKTVTGTGSTNQTNTIYSIDFAPVAGKEITISFDLVSSVNSGTATVQWNNTPWGTLSGGVSVSTTKQHFSKTVTQPTSGAATAVQLRLDNINGTVTISNLKIELGNKATDWTVAPEDIDSSISSINTTLSSQSSSISQLQGSITSKVEKNDVYTKTDTDGKISSAISTAKTEIKQTTDSITSTVSNVSQSVADASPNLIRNTSWTKNLDYWNVDVGYIDSAKSVVGTGAVRIEKTGLTSDAWQGMFSEFIDLSPGQKVNASGYSLIDNLSADDQSYYIEIEWYNSSNARITTTRKIIKPTAINSWQRFDLPATAPTNTVKARMRFYVQRNGRIWVNRPMFVLGDKAPSVYGAMPNDTAIQSISTQISQTADEVSTNVVKKGNVVTSINASAEGVKIKGNKIDIDGTVTFTSLNPEMQNKVNDGTSAKSAIDSLDVGGTNLLTGTNFDSSTGFYRWGSGTFTNVTNDSYVGFNYLQMETKDDSGNGLTVSKGTAIGIQTNGHTFRVIKGRQYTVSMIIATSELDGVLDYCYLMHGNGSNSYSLPNVKTYDFPYVMDVSSGSPATRGYYKVSYTFTADVTDDKAYILVGGRTTRDVSGSSYAWIRISQLQVEEGNKATSWSLSPVDIANGISSAVSTASADATNKADQAKKDAISETGSWISSYKVNTATILPLKDVKGSNLNDAYSYEVQARTTGTGTESTSISYLLSKGDGSGWDLSIEYEMGNSSNHPKILINGGVPSVTLYNHTTVYNVEVKLVAYRGRYLPSKKAADDANKANSAIADMSSDGKVTPVEKTQLKKEWATITAEKTTYYNMGTTFSLTSQRDAYNTSFNTLQTDVNSVLSNMTTTSTINGATFRNKFDDYYDKKAQLIRAVNENSKSLADSAQTTANSAKSDIADMSSDGKITPVEKVQLKKEWATIVAEKTTLYNMGTTFGKTSERDAFNTSYNNLNNLLNGTSGVLLSMTTTSTVTGSTFRNTFDDYYDKKAVLIKATSETARTLANNAQSTANTANSTANTANSTANYAKSTVDGGKNKWEGAYSLTETWRKGNTTQIDGGNIYTQSIQAKSMVMADFTNLCENPDFEGDADGANPMGFNPQGNFRVVDISQYSYTNGSNRALWIDASSTGNSDAYVSNLIPVSKGQQFYVGAEARYYNTNGTGYGRIGFRRYDAKKNGINAWDSVAWWNGAKSQNFNYQSGTYTVPDGCSYLQIWISFANNGTTNNSFIIDNIRVHRMANAELIVDGVIEGRHIKADSITFDKAKGGTLKLGGTGNENGVLEVYSSEGELIANLDGDKGGFTSLYVADFDSPSVVEYGDANLNFYVSDRWLDYSGAVDPSDENSGSGWAQPLATIGEALRRIPKFNDGNVTINLPYSGVFYENIDILGYLGTGSITISGGNGVRINGNIRAYKTLNNVYFKNFTLNGIAGSYGNIQLAQSPYINAENVYVYGNNSQRAFDVRENAYAQISNCEMYDVDYGINSRYGATTYVYNCKGLGAVCGLYAYGGYIVGKGTAPGGTKYASAQTGDGGMINSTFTYNLGSAAPPPVPETTKSFSASSGNAWRDNFSGQWYNQGIVAQGYWGGYGVYRGLWFFGTSLSDTVKGKTIKSMRMYVKRTTSGGNSGSVTCYFRSHNYTGQPSGTPSLGGSYTTATFKWGEGKWINIPSAMWSDFTSGTAKGIGIYINSTSQNYYARFGTSATIEVTYK